MPTKAGKLKFEDIRQGRVVWMVAALKYAGQIHALAPVRATLAGRPYKAITQRGGRLWTFVFHTVTEYSIATARRRHCISCASVGVGPDFEQYAMYSRMFVTEEAATKYLHDLDAKLVDTDTLSAMNSMVALERQMEQQNQQRSALNRYGVAIVQLCS
jgi:hypothetical protein